MRWASSSCWSEMAAALDWAAGLDWARAGGGLFHIGGEQRELFLQVGGCLDVFGSALGCAMGGTGFFKLGGGLFQGGGDGDLIGIRSTQRGNLEFLHGAVEFFQIGREG